MFATRESLLAGLEAQVASKWIPNSLFDWTAYLLALVFLTRLQLPAHLLALVILNILYLFWAHSLQF